MHRHHTTWSDSVPALGIVAHSSALYLCLVYFQATGLGPVPSRWHDLLSSECAALLCIAATTTSTIPEHGCEVGRQLLKLQLHQIDLPYQAAVGKLCLFHVPHSRIGSASSLAALVRHFQCACQCSLEDCLVSAMRDGCPGWAPTLCPKDPGRVMWARAPHEKNILRTYSDMDWLVTCHRLCGFQGQQILCCWCGV